MSQFSELYGEDLDRELGTADRTQRFTTARRKRAVNQAQDEFIRATECLVVESEFEIVDQEQEFDLATVVPTDKFMRLATRQPFIKIDNGITVTYFGGKDLPRKDIETLDREEGTGWRSASAGRPLSWYIRDDSEAELLGIYPKAHVLPGETWTLVVPFVSKADPMVQDEDFPFNAKMSLEVYHQALVHYAAAQLEKLRRNYVVSAAQQDAFQAYVNEYIGNRGSNAGDVVEFARDYFGDASIRSDKGLDPRRDD